MGRRTFVVIVGLAAAMVIAFAAMRFVGRSERTCSDAARASSPSDTVVVCRREYERTRAPATGIRLADALRLSGDADGAEALARALIATPAAADAYHVIGKIEISRDRYDDAAAALETARKLHRAAGDSAALARDDQTLARVVTERERFAEALAILDECTIESRRARDTVIEGYCRLSAARVLSRVGYFELARQELERAAALTVEDRDLAWLELERGNLDQELSRMPLQSAHNEQAVIAFERALALARSARLPGVAIISELNLAYSLAELGRTDDATKHLDKARVLDTEHDNASAIDQLAARIAYRRGDHDTAWSSNERLYPAVSDPDDRLDVATMQARIALARGELAGAELWAMRGVEAAELIRSTQSVTELRPWVLSTRREPYELLFVTLARAGRAEDALLAFDRWQGRTMLDAMARPDPSAPDLGDAARRIERIGAWLPIVSHAPFADPATTEAVKQTLRQIDVLALVVADREVWRLTGTQGHIEVRGLGPLAKLEQQIEHFEATPTDPVLAESVGSLFVPAELFASSRTLHLYVDGLLAGLPLAAVRHAKRPLIAVRPIVRIPRLPAASCITVSPAHTATVIADAEADLPAARREAAEVARVLGTEAMLGTAAATTGLFRTERDAVLHLAVHVDFDTGGGRLRLNDRAVSALEISAHRLGPALVVLSACSSARANDAELSGSLATAFLSAGSRHVLGTIRAVSDAGALEVATRFYRENGTADPVRALAKIQATLATTTNTDWPSFTVFGHDVCTP